MLHFRLHLLLNWNSIRRFTATGILSTLECSFRNRDRSMYVLRGVVLTAAEMNAADRFSFVIVEEENLLNGNLEDVTIEGVTDVIKKLPEYPKAVLLFTVCLHHFLGCDLDRVYQELEERFPEIVFIRCYMDPIMQKTGLTPDQKLRKAMYDPLPERTPETKSVSLLGSDFALDETADIPRFLKEHGYAVRELPACKTWEEYLELSASELFVSFYPPGRYGAEVQAERLGRKHLYLMRQVLGHPNLAWSSMKKNMLKNVFVGLMPFPCVKKAAQRL